MYNIGYNFCECFWLVSILSPICIRFVQINYSSFNFLFLNTKNLNSLFSAYLEYESMLVIAKLLSNETNNLNLIFECDSSFLLKLIFHKMLGIKISKKRINYFKLDFKRFKLLYGDIYQGLWYTEWLMVYWLTYTRLSAHLLPYLLIPCVLTLTKCILKIIEIKW